MNLNVVMNQAHAVQPSSVLSSGQGSRWRYATHARESANQRKSEETCTGERTTRALREGLHPQFYLEWIDICG